MLKNLSTNKVICKNVCVANKYLSKLKGLMFENKQKFSYALVISLNSESKIKASIHMLFVFFPIAVFFLNKEKRVVDKKVLKPFTLNYTPKQPSKYIIELPAEYIDSAKLGDKLDWK
ncbi:MAG: DUF192 domain-containing protein [Candidatus Diapherotrites archaeon]